METIAPPRPAVRVGRENDVAILAVAVVVIAAAALLAVTPDRGGVTVFGQRLPELCGMKQVGASCPGCGLTRSFVLGVRADPEAFRLHPAGPILLALLAAQIPYRALRLLRPARPAGDPTPIMFGLGGLVLLGWLVRMVWL